MGRSGVCVCVGGGGGEVCVWGREQVKGACASEAGDHPTLHSPR